MVAVRPFRALVVSPAAADRTVSLPYDVMNADEAAQMVVGGRNQFLHVSRPEIDLPAGADPHSPEAYAQAARALAALVADGTFVRHSEPVMLVLRETMGELVQTGLVASASVDDYDRTDIRIHEFTRPDKELDRVNHIDAVEAHDEPVFLTYRADEAISAVIARATNGAPLIDVTADGGVRHELWVIDDQEDLRGIVDLFAAIPRTYVADGHHRSAAASVVRKRRKGDNPPATPALNGLEFADGLDGFLAVLVPSDSTNVMAYNRVVRDLAGMSAAEFLDRLDAVADVEPVNQAVVPDQKFSFGMLLGDQWHLCRYRDVPDGEADPLEALDVSLLQDRILSPILGIADPRTDQRISFVGGIRGTAELERLVGQGAAVAFCLPATPVLDLIAVADKGDVMPPKSTWFEPKLPSGLFIHPFS